jgi:hypothetical protein
MSDGEEYVTEYLWNESDIVTNMQINWFWKSVLLILSLIIQDSPPT